MKDEHPYYVKVIDTRFTHMVDTMYEPAWPDRYIVPVASNSITTDFKLFQENTSL